MLFCPTCANFLVISADTGYNKWACNTCAYEFPITKQVSAAGFDFRRADAPLLSTFYFVLVLTKCG